MAYKQTRPLNMKGPLKRSGLKLGRATKSSGVEYQTGENLNDDSGAFFYNSKMGPMQMHSPSALKQMEEEMAPQQGMAPEVPTQEPEGEKPQTISFDETEMEGGDMGEVKQDGGGVYVIIPNEDGLGDFPPNTKVIIPEAMLAETGAQVGELLSGGDYTATLNANGEYELTSTDAEDMWK